MKFGQLQKAYFGASDGAYSIVTSNEREKGQITLSEIDGEAGIAVDHFGEYNIPREASDGKRLAVMVIDRSDGLVRPSDLTINFPKSKGNELRIYRGASAGFGYEAGDVWYVFVRNGKLHVGSMLEHKWRAIGTLDSNDGDFQEAVDEGSDLYTPKYVTFAGTSIAREPAIARQAITDSQYICAYSGAPTPFISKRTQKPYLEAHHLIPLGLEPILGFKVDVPENIFALNPLWHRAIHHAAPDKVRDILTKLAKQRQSFLLSKGLDANELIRLYGCETIVTS
jgi:5-methylcytosine-specific restriction protein A